MKHTVHVTVTLSVEVDEELLKAEYGKKNKKTILDYAIQNADFSNVFETKAVIFESYDDKVKVRKGIGSY